MPTPFVTATVAFATCALVTPCVRNFAHRKGLFDHPGALKIHRKAVPRIGGVSMMFGILASILLSFAELRPNDWIALSVIVAIWIVGLADDVWGLSPSLRLACQLCAGAVLWTDGWRLHWFSIPVLDLLATCLLFALMINAMNMLDGVDGLAAGVAGIGSVGFVILFVPWHQGIPLAEAIIGVCLAILVFNFPPASIFMGDSGSTLLGAAIGVMLLKGAAVERGFSRSLPLLLFLLLPIADAGLAIVRRLRKRHSPFQGDRRHYYDLLLKRGWSTQQVLVASYGFSAVLVLVGVLCAQGRINALLAAETLSVATLWFAYLLGSFTPSEPLHKPQNAKPASALNTEA